MSSIPPSADAADSRPSAVQIWLAIRKNWPLVAALIALVTAGTAFYSLGQTKIYEATATIMFDPNVPRPLGEQTGAVGDLSSYWNNKE